MFIQTVSSEIILFNSNSKAQLTAPLTVSGLQDIIEVTGYHLELSIGNMMTITDRNGKHLVRTSSIDKAVDIFNDYYISEPEPVRAEMIKKNGYYSLYEYGVLTKSEHSPMLLSQYLHFIVIVQMSDAYYVYDLDGCTGYSSTIDGAVSLFNAEASMY